MNRRCYHGPLTDEEDRKKKWLSKDSDVYKVFCNIVLDKNLDKDLTQMAKFKHTGNSILLLMKRQLVAVAVQKTIIYQ